MLKHYVPFILLSCNCAVYAGPEVYERYDFNGRVENTATVGVSPAVSENLKFVTIGTNLQVADNSQENPERISALPDVKAQLPSGLSSLRVSAWVRTKDWFGSIRTLRGQLDRGDRKGENCEFSVGISDGKVTWSARGANFRSQSLWSRTRINDGNWHYVTAVSKEVGGSRAVVALYVDGELQAWKNEWLSVMTPTDIRENSAFGFMGQMALLETAEPGEEFVQGNGEHAKSATTDPTWNKTKRIPGYKRVKYTPGATASQVVNVEDFGAMGSDAADDTQALQQAVAALRPAEGINTLYFPPGIYLTKKSLKLPSGIDVVGIRANLKGMNVPAIELVGDIEGISFLNLEIGGRMPAAVFQHGGKARHVYFYRCSVYTPAATSVLPDEPHYQQWLALNDKWKGKDSHGLLFTDVEDSTIIGGSFTAGLAGIAVEGRMRNLAVLRTIVAHGPNLVGFYFNTPKESSCLLLNNTVHCNKGYVIKAPVVKNLIMRGMSTEANGLSLPPEVAFEPMYDILNGSNVDMEMINLAPLSWRKNNDRKWDGSQIRINGRNNIIAGCFLIEPDNAENPSLDSDDPMLTVWGTNLPTADLNLTGGSGNRRVLASRFGKGNYTDTIQTSEATYYPNLEKPASLGTMATSDQHQEPELWGPPARRFNWNQLALPSVRAYGAVGDGKTDDSSAFRRALADGGIVFVPAGTYLISTPIHSGFNLNRYSGFVLLGEGMDKTILKASTNQTALIDFPWRGKITTNGKPAKVPQDVHVDGSIIMDMSFVGGSHGVLIQEGTSGWLINSVAFRGQTVAGFVADSFDNGNILTKCSFEGAEYGFVAGGWNRCFVDKTFLWKCSFDKQSINGVLIGSAKNQQGQRPNGWWMHTVLRDCVIRNSGQEGVVIMSTSARPNFLDHCLIENCGQKKDVPYVRFMRGGGSCAAAYNTTIKCTSGPPRQPLLKVEDYTWSRFQNVDIIGAKGGSAVEILSPYCWLENVRADGKLQTPGGSRIVDHMSVLPEQQADVSNIGQSRLIQNCNFSF